MACALGSSGRGLFGRSGSYESPFSRNGETYLPYQERPFGGYAGQQRHPYAHMHGNSQSSFGGLGGPGFSNLGQYNPYTRSSGYANLGTSMGMGVPIGSGGYSGRGFGFSQSPFAGLQSPCGFGPGSTTGREHRSRFSSRRRGLTSIRGRYPSPQMFDDGDNSDDEDYSSFMQYKSQRQRQALFGHRQRPTHGMRSMPRYYSGYDDYDGYDDDDDDDDYDDYLAQPSRRQQRYY